MTCSKTPPEAPQRDLSSIRTVGSSPSPEKGTEELTGGSRSIWILWANLDSYYGASAIAFCSSEEKAEQARAKYSNKTYGYRTDELLVEQQVLDEFAD